MQEMAFKVRYGAKIEPRGNCNSLQVRLQLPSMPIRRWSPNIDRSTTRMIVCSYPVLQVQSELDTLGMQEYCREKRVEVPRIRQDAFSVSSVRCSVPFQYSVFSVAIPQEEYC